jgi:hypothetical protein
VFSAGPRGVVQYCTTSSAYTVRAAHLRSCHRPSHSRPPACIRLVRSRPWGAAGDAAPRQARRLRDSRPRPRPACAAPVPIMVTSAPGLLPASRQSTSVCAATTIVRSREQPLSRTCRRLATAVVVAAALASAHGSTQRSANRPDCALACGRQASNSPGLLPAAKPSTSLPIPHATTRTRPGDSLAMVTHRVFICACKNKKINSFF